MRALNNNVDFRIFNEFMDNIFKSTFGKIQSRAITRKSNKPQIKYISYLITDDAYKTRPTKIKITFASDESSNKAIFEYNNDNQICSFVFYTEGGNTQYFEAQYKKNNFVRVLKDRFFFYELVEFYSEKFILDKNINIINDNSLIIDTDFKNQLEKVFIKNITACFLAIGNQYLQYQAGFQLLYSVKDNYLIRFCDINKKPTVELFVDDNAKKIYFCNVSIPKVGTTQLSNDRVELVSSSGNDTTWEGNMSAGKKFSISKNGITRDRERLQWSNQDLYHFPSNKNAKQKVENGLRKLKATVPQNYKLLKEIIEFIFSDFDRSFTVNTRRFQIENDEFTVNYDNGEISYKDILLKQNSKTTLKINPGNFEADFKTFSIFFYIASNNIQKRVKYLNFFMDLDIEKKESAFIWNFNFSDIFYILTRSFPQINAILRETFTRTHRSYSDGFNLYNISSDDNDKILMIKGGNTDKSERIICLHFKNDKLSSIDDAPSVIERPFIPSGDDHICNIEGIRYVINKNNIYKFTEQSSEILKRNANGYYEWTSSLSNINSNLVTKYKYKKSSGAAASSIIKQSSQGKVVSPSIAKSESSISMNSVDDNITLSNLLTKLNSVIPNESSDSHEIKNLKEKARNKIKGFKVNLLPIEGSNITAQQQLKKKINMFVRQVQNRLKTNINSKRTLTVKQSPLLPELNILNSSAESFEFVPSTPRQTVTGAIETTLFVQPLNSRVQEKIPNKNNEQLIRETAAAAAASSAASAAASAAASFVQPLNSRVQERIPMKNNEQLIRETAAAAAASSAASAAASTNVVQGSKNLKIHLQNPT